MSNPWPKMPFSAAVEVNPRRPVARGTLAPFVDMAALPTEIPEVRPTGVRPVGAGGSRFTNGDTLFARITPCTENGKTGLVDCLSVGEIATGSTEFIVLGPRSHLTLSRFVYYLAKSPTFRSFAISRMRGTSGRQRVPGNVFDDFSVQVPPLPEQRKIAAILSSVDDAIEKTQAVIDQVQVVKRGLMQELLTRGLPGRHTQFQRTVLGELPKLWTVTTVGAVAAPGEHSCVGGPFGSDLTRRDYVNSPGIPVIRGSNLASVSPWLMEEQFVFVSRAKADALQRNAACPGDLIFTQRGTLGQVCRIPLKSRFPRYVLSQSQMRVSVDERRVNPDYLLAYFRSPRALKLIEVMTIGTGVPHLNLGILRTFPVPVPSLEEQCAIVRHLSSTDARIESELQSLTALRDLRSGLISVLLSGEIRFASDAGPT